MHGSRGGSWKRSTTWSWSLGWHTRPGNRRNHGLRPTARRRHRASSRPNHPQLTPLVGLWIADRHVDPRSRRSRSPARKAYVIPPRHPAAHRPARHDRRPRPRRPTRASTECHGAQRAGHRRPGRPGGVDLTDAARCPPRPGRRPRARRPSTRFADAGVRCGRRHRLPGRRVRPCRCRSVGVRPHMSVGVRPDVSVPAGGS